MAGIFNGGSYFIWLKSNMIRLGLRGDDGTFFNFVLFFDFANY